MWQILDQRTIHLMNNNNNNKIIITSNTVIVYKILFICMRLFRVIFVIKKGLGPISQSNKIHSKTNCQLWFVLWHHTLLSNFEWFAVKNNLSYFWNRPLLWEQLHPRGFRTNTWFRDLLCFDQRLIRSFMSSKMVESAAFPVECFGIPWVDNQHFVAVCHYFLIIWFIFKENASWKNNTVNMKVSNIN